MSDEVIEEAAPAARPSRAKLSTHIKNAARILKSQVEPLGLFGERLTKAIATLAGCATHDPVLHFHGLGIDNTAGQQEEWLSPYSDASDLERRVRLLPVDTWLTRWPVGVSHQTPFKPRLHDGPLVLYVHEGALQVSVGYSHDGERPPVVSRSVYPAGSRFEAVTPGAWVALCPLTPVVMTISGVRPIYDASITPARVLPQNLTKFLAMKVADSLTTET